jgi:hypothetical protein
MALILPPAITFTVSWFFGFPSVFDLRIEICAFRIRAYILHTNFSRKCCRSNSRDLHSLYVAWFPFFSYIFKNILWRIDPLLRGDCKRAIAMERPQHTRARWRLTTIKEVMQAVLSVRPLRGYMARPTVFCWASECSAVEGSPVEY